MKTPSLVCIAIMTAASLLLGCGAPQESAPGSSLKDSGFAGGSSGPYAVKTTLRELVSVDPAKGIGVYGRYTELAAEGEVPEVLTQILDEVNARAKESVETRAAQFLAENDWPDAESTGAPEAEDEAESVDAEAPEFEDEADSVVTERYSYRTISCITNVTRADETLISILETEMEGGIGTAEGDWTSEAENCRFSGAVYDTQSGEKLDLADLVSDADDLSALLEEAFASKYGVEGICDGLGPGDAFGDELSSAEPGNGSEGEEADGVYVPAWTADYLGVRFYLDGAQVPKEIRDQLSSDYRRKALHVSIPYSALGGPLCEAAGKTPESFIAQVEKNVDYALPHADQTIRIEKAATDYGTEEYRIVISDGKSGSGGKAAGDDKDGKSARDDEGTKAWWLEYATDGSDFYVFRAQGKYYFYRLDDLQDRGYVYSFGSPDGGFDRFANQNAQCFDSFLHEIRLALPYDPDCAHMREKTRSFTSAAPGMSAILVPSGHYAFLPEPGRGRTWLHFSLTDDALALDTRNVGCRLLHDVSAVALDPEGNETGEITIPAGEVLRFLRVDGESELYYYMSTSYYEHQSGSMDYLYDCELTDGSLVRLVTRYENSFFVDGMYMDRIGEAVYLGSAQYETGAGEVPEHTVKIGGKEYKLIQDLSLKTESGEEIDFEGDTWWKVENYVGTFRGEEENAKLTISESGRVLFEYDGRFFKGKLPEKRYYRQNVDVYMESGYERRTFTIIVDDDLPAHDPGFTEITFYSAGEPATNEPSHVPPIEVQLTRE